MFTRECFGWCLSLFASSTFSEKLEGVLEVRGMDARWHPRFPGNLDSKVAIWNLKRAPLHCGTDGWDGKETWKQIKIKVNEMDLNVTQNCVSSKWKGDASLVREPGEPLLGQPFKGLGKRREVRSVPGQLTMMMKMFNHNGDDDGEMENYLELKSHHHHHHHYSHHHHHDKCIWITLGWRANTEQGCLSPPCSPAQSEMKKMVNCLKYQRRCWWECSMDDNDGQIWWNLPAGLQGSVGSLCPP